ncbi:Phospholipase C [Candidatus Koribacter versatilis Ellin345]|uniref:Phospholipase C n=1 Tax=Koribacter versatilis (strain Ellin345) TaxID=204669 RepID=Q1ITR4_KORVE|nr:alkaline phosphatase family protein [Candidatus Koribacter versatilis]ABF39736.1 Phospholipase C [Candidatus Koribacter versatilis Ellin345]
MKRSFLVVLLALCLAAFSGCGSSSGGSGSGGSGGSGGGGGGSKPPGNGQLSQLNHIVFMLQENRSFDQYFGKLNDYRTAHGKGADVDGLPAGASNPSNDGTSTVASFHFATVCSENVTPSWNASRRDINRYNPTSTTYNMDGFVYSAAHYAQDNNAQRPGAYTDTEGIRAMGYYTDADLPYYYFMATQFATSDRFFSPILSRTPPNRLATFAASALGVVNDIPANTTYSQDTIFTLLQNAGITWKIYETSGNTYLGYFGSFYAKYKSTNIAPISQYFDDVKNGKLPQVAFIETGVETSDEGGTSSLDEHPDANIQKGAAYVAKIINALMTSSSWKDSAFILTYDEGGGNYDHVPPHSAAVPDSTPPMLQPTDDPDTYNRTGFRVPILVISPFTKVGYVSHTVMDTTAILKFIEKRFSLPSLTARDAAQADMSEFFDFTNIPNQTAPSGVPTQPTSGTCSIHSITP